MANGASIATIRAGILVALTATLLVVNALLQPVPAGAQCNPTCTDKCKAQLKACKGTAQLTNKTILASCAYTAKIVSAACAFEAVNLKTIQCLDKCGVDLETCKLAGKQDVESCKLSIKTSVAGCKDSAKQSLQQTLTDCAIEDATCLSLCP